MRDKRYYRYNDIVQVPPVTDELANMFAKRSDCYSKVIRHRSNGLKPTEYWAIPQALADEYGIEYKTDYVNATKEDEKKKQRYLTDDGYIVHVYQFVDGTIKGKNYKYLSGIFAYGSLLAQDKYAGHKYRMVYFHSSVTFPENIHNDIPHRYQIGKKGGVRHDPRFKYFVRTFLITGDILFSYRFAYRVAMHSRNDLANAKELLQKQEAIAVMDKILKNRLDTLIQSMGYDDSTIEEVAIRIRLSLIDKAMSQDKNMDVAEKALTGLEELLGMRAERGGHGRRKVVPPQLVPPEDALPSITATEKKELLKDVEDAEVL